MTTEQEIQHLADEISDALLGAGGEEAEVAEARWRTNEAVVLDEMAQEGIHVARWAWG